MRSSSSGGRERDIVIRVQDLDALSLGDGGFRRCYSKSHFQRDSSTKALNLSLVHQNVKVVIADPPTFKAYSPRTFRQIGTSFWGCQGRKLDALGIEIRRWHKIHNKTVTTDD